MYEEEEKYLISKKYTCPVCDKQIRAKSVKSNTARFVETKSDLRPIYSNVNVTKYDTVCCNYCGFSALTKDFNNTTPTQRKLIRENISSRFTEKEEMTGETYSTEAAITRLKMVLLCSKTKGAKPSEIGNICLKISWLYQDLADSVEENDTQSQEKRDKYLAESKHAAKNAYDTLSDARMHEDFPIAGMNESTLDYLLAYYSYEFGEYNQALKLLSGVITSRSVSPRLKEKSLDLKELISAKHQEEPNQ